MTKTSKYTPHAQALIKILSVILLLFIFLVGIKGMGSGFKMLGKDMLQVFFTATQSPFVGLVVGILATTLVQSSSVTTSMIVAMVAAPENPLPVVNAIPMIMGANIGTTVTSSIVALAHMGRRDEFRRAFAAATCHDFFNWMAVAILLPLELLTGVLSRGAQSMASLFTGWGGVEYKSPLKVALKVTSAPIKQIATTLTDQGLWQASIVVVISAGLIFVALMLIVKLLRSAMRTRVEVYLNRALGTHALVSMTVGMVITIMVQSSSITTSLLVPLAGAGIITLPRIFPITLGANVGTTVTALLASMAVSGANAGAGMQVALVHLLFNVLGIVIIYPIPALRRLPLMAAERLAALAVSSKSLAIVYVVGLFYILPGLLVVIDKYLF